MSDTAAFPGTGGCPACVAVQDLPRRQGVEGQTGAPLRRFEISLPTIHCAACISGVEQILDSVPGVAAARVNLTLKRVSVTAEDVPGMDDQLLGSLNGRGFEARPLDSAALEATRTDAEGRFRLPIPDR